MLLLRPDIAVSAKTAEDEVHLMFSFGEFPAEIADLEGRS